MAETLVYNHNHDVRVWHKKTPNITITGETTVRVPVVVLLMGTSPSLNATTKSEVKSQSK